MAEGYPVTFISEQSERGGRGKGSFCFLDSWDRTRRTGTEVEDETVEVKRNCNKSWTAQNALTVKELYKNIGEYCS